MVGCQWQVSDISGYH